MSAAAQRRAARFGDAWFPSMLLASELAPAHRRLRDLAVDQGRPEPAITLGAAALLGPPQPAARDSFVRGLTDGYGISAETAGHVPITGNVSQAADRLAEYADAGVSHLVVGLVGENWPGQCDLLAQVSSGRSGPGREWPWGGRGTSPPFTGGKGRPVSAGAVASSPRATPPGLCRERG